MSHELETAAAMSLGGFFRRGKHHPILPLDSPCPNCSMPLKGAWCYSCGQVAEDFHRSATKLVLESVREVFDFDNRIWQTLPDLVYRPGRLTRSYLDGHRAPQVPPLRFFLVVLLLLFLVGSDFGSRPTLAPPGGNEAQAIQKIEQNPKISTEDKKEIEADIRAAQMIEKSRKPSAFGQWLKGRITYAATHKNEFWQAVQNWAERFAFLMLPLAAGLMSLLFVLQRRFFLYDHIIFSMHSLSFLCLLGTVWILWNRYLPDVGGLPVLAAATHLFFHMRGVYGTSIFGTLMRMFGLFIGSVIGAVFIVLGLLWVALTSM